MLRYYTVSTSYFLDVLKFFRSIYCSSSCLGRGTSEVIGSIFED
jgi:hypothetical protein